MGKCGYVCKVVGIKKDGRVKISLLDKLKFKIENIKWRKLNNRIGNTPKEDKKIEKIKISSRFTRNQKVIIHKINEIIDRLKGEK